MLGIADGAIARRRSLNFRLSIVAIVIAAATLCLDIVIALKGLQTVTFGS